MDATSLGIGSISVCFGVATLVARATRPQWFTKLEAMKARWGDLPGLIVHIVAYSIVPLIFGAVAISLGLRGISLF